MSKDHTWAWPSNDHCVACGMGADEIAISGQDKCAAYLPDRFDTADDFARIWEVTKGMAKGQ